MDETFESFFRERVKERGISIKKLSELTGIASAHLENMLRGSFEDIPSAPYFHGYLIRLGKVLDFDAEEWWIRIRKEGLVKNSGPSDALPHNRFVRQSPAKVIIIVIVIVALLAYLVIELPRILGKPALTLSFPDQNPYTTSASAITMEGSAHGANSLYLNGDEVTIVKDGSWQKGVLLQNGINTFEISAKKLLGGETDIVEQIIYTLSANATNSATTTLPTGIPTSSSSGTGE